MTVAEVLDLVGRELDDPDLIHTPEAVAIHQVSRAQIWVCLAWKVLRQDVSVPLVTRQALVHWPSLLPTAAGVVTVALNGVALWPIAWQQIRLADPQWLSTPGSPAHWYTMGVSYIGVYPAANGAMTLKLTGVQVPTTVTAGAETLQAPDAWIPQIVDVTTGLLLLGRERSYRAGLQRIAKALGVNNPNPAPQGA